MKKVKILIILLSFFALSLRAYFEPEQLVYCAPTDENHPSATGHCRHTENGEHGELVFRCDWFPGYPNQPMDCIGDLMTPVPQ
ncbi:MAG: hypothetical protein VYB44_00520 [Bacteroidota bacterium]|nr:hypothetical protein [Bacteroidota bacterium]